jgi:hypothetical protein
METTDRYFTLEEAQGLVPWLQSAFDAIEPLKRQLARAKDMVQELSVVMQSNGGGSTQDKLEQAQQDLQDAEDSIDEHAYAIVERGIILRSVERGLVDFPAMRDNRIVYLCWLAGETEITHWHEIDAGIAGRQRL